MEESDQIEAETLPDFGQLSKHAISFGQKPAEVVNADSRSCDDFSPVQLEPDPRWQNSIVGTREDLEREASTWEIGPFVPDQVAEMLSVSRRLFVHSYFVHEFAAVAVVWSLLATEATLRKVLEVSPTDRTGFKKLIGQARGRGLLTEDEAVQLDAGRQFRNALIHTDRQSAFTLGMSIPLLRGGHSLVARLFRRGESQSDQT